jgi:hypothetical protein
MIKLDYSIAASWSRKIEQYNLAQVSEEDLRYRLFLGDIIILGNNCNLSTSWEWVPVVDFASSLLRIKDELSDGTTRSSTFEFTESGDTITFNRVNGVVKVECSYRQCSAESSIQELILEIDAFVQNVFTTLICKYSAVQANETFSRLFRKS